MAPPDIACPRCGYDLSGAVAAWEDCCPLTGVCSECGYRFEWGGALARASGAGFALYEVAQARGSYALFRSVAMAFRPRALWREAIRGEPIRAERLLAVLGLGLLASHLLVTLVFQIATLIARASGAGGWETEERLIELTLGYPTQPMALGVLAGNGVICLLLVGASATMNDERFRTGDVVRACAYWLVTAPLIAAAAELIILVDFEPIVRQFRGAARVFARDAAPSVTGLALAGLYGWMWFWWAVAFRHYFQIPHPRVRSFLATGGFIAAAVATGAVANIISVVMEIAR